MQEAEGAIPSVPTIHARVAQTTEHGASNAGDEGETPSASAIILQGVMSAADGLVRNEEVAGATPATLTISGRQADISWLHLS
jgi:hypothetical protein